MGDGRFQMHALLVAHAHSLAADGLGTSGDIPRGSGDTA
jgi:hypothetical protein